MIVCEREQASENTYTFQTDETGPADFVQGANYLCMSHRIPGSDYEHNDDEYLHAVAHAQSLKARTKVLLHALHALLIFACFTQV